MDARILRYTSFFVLLFLAIHTGAQEIVWAEPKQGVQLGVEMRCGELSCRLAVYCRRTSEDIVGLSPFPETKLFMSRGDQVYEVIPAYVRPLNEETMRILSPHGGRKGVVLYNKQDMYPLETYIVPKLEPFPSCYDPWVDSCHVEVRGLVGTAFVNDSSIVHQSAKLVVKHCADVERSKAEQRERDRFLQSLLKMPDGSPFELAIAIASDTSQHDIYRGLVGDYLSELDTQESRDVLFSVCKESDDPDLSEFLYYFFMTKDPRSLAFIDRYSDHPQKMVRAEIAWAIGMLGSEAHIPILAKTMRDSIRQVRVISAAALAEFNTHAARELLHACLKDTELSVRSEAARALCKVGESSSLEHLAAYIESENPNHKGYINDAFRCAEKISGVQLDGDLEKLKALIK